MNKTFKFYHGDVDWFQIDKLPKGAVLTETVTKHITENGTATGHKHVVSSKQPFEVYKYGENGLAYVFTVPAEASHEEHLTLDIVPGIYVIEHEQEEDPRTGLVMEVVD